MGLHFMYHKWWITKELFVEYGKVFLIYLHTQNVLGKMYSLLMDSHNTFNYKLMNDIVKYFIPVLYFHYT